MSDKEKFIRDFVIRKAPETYALNEAIYQAEKIWEGLSERGYGDKKTAPVKAKDKSHYAALTEEQRVWFDRFWQAFNYKSGKEGAAKEWLRLGKLTPEHYQAIVDAAKRTANTPLPPGITRKMAQGWLSEKRYEDEHYYETVTTTPAKPAKLSAGEQVRERTKERKLLL